MHVVVDATAGNGHDTVVLARLLAQAGKGTLVACDVQNIAIERTRDRLHSELSGKAGWRFDSQRTAGWCEGDVSLKSAPPAVNVELRLSDHAELLEGLAPASVSLIVFNLGYLPSGDKAIVTTAEGTIRALRAAERCLRPGGCVSVTIYPGHGNVPPAHQTSRLDPHACVTLLVARAQVRFSLCALLAGFAGEGLREEGAILEYAAALPQGRWSVHHTQWLNQRARKNAAIRAPSVLLIQCMNDGT